MMDWTPSLLLLCAFSLAFVPAALTEAKDRSKTAKGRRGQARDRAQLPGAQTSPPGPRLKANGLATDDTYTRVEEYEESIQEMVRQLRNSSEPPDTKCQVSLGLWSPNKRSLSPWAYSINHDATRIPTDIPEAQCLCTGCINPFTMQEDRTMASIPIYSRLPVRRLLCQPGVKAPRKKKGCHKKYRMVMETIAVGCTCIF
ncbi:PREDICTED: interleukin-17B [Crocodylus porosus]|uniref:interleukin-17B n=1 Tax=Crocodylus porosus TaxID=8502 RepID=UPI00093A1534|nr:PREDICTED: interleukin-17B [Crocodylus porosus]